MKCEATDCGEKCGKEARFKILDFECGGYDGKYDVRFWVCNDCIKFFIKRNEDDPHYILLKEQEMKK